jgi:hypothetical protein
VDRRKDDRGVARRTLVRAILASGVGMLVARTAIARRALVTPRGGGAAPLQRGAVLPLATDLAADARASRERRLPILLFLDREECPYCEQALREYLVPMAQEPLVRALFRQVEIDRALPLVDFAGRSTTHRALAERYRVTLSPTVLVVGPDGERLADPVVGLMVDFYAGYLDRALADSAAKLR